MRHVKLSPEGDVDAAALSELIETAYADMKGRLMAGEFVQAFIRFGFFENKWASRITIVGG
jgi:hypothetical protein